MVWLKFDYFLLIFVTSCGLLQGVFAYTGRVGLQFFVRRALAYVFAVVCSVGAFLWFFTRPNYDLPPRILEGSQQTTTFMMGAVAAVVFSVLLSSLINRRRRFPVSQVGDIQGLDDLKYNTYFRTFPAMGRDLLGLVRSLVSKARK
ncbi:MAG: hypothetical protein Q7T05_08725 [Dehalococcoidia bacterium]|nr:hypothetical protein [Dehalococcoidia bacterium]